MDNREKGFEEEIRRKLSQAPVDFDESAWEKMERKLSKVSPGKRGALSLWWLRGAAALVILAAGIWAYTNFLQPGEQRREEYAGQDSGDRPNEEFAGQGPEDTAGTEKKSIAGGERNTGSLFQRKNRAGISIAADQRREENMAGSVPELKRRTFSAAAPVREGPAAKWPRDAALLAAGPPAGSGTETESEAGTEGSGVSFSLSVLAAPDMNGVRSLEQGKIGVNAGLGFGVHFNDRLSLHTGIAYSKKPYDARPADYHIGRDVPDLVNIVAECNVVDIPLNLRYAFYRQGRNTISLEAGLSSYLMLRERYSYEYGHYDPRVYEYRNQNRHFMGVGNAGIAFERRLNDKMSIGLQPFIKVPLTGIGQGNVKLISAGAAVQLNLGLNKK